MRHRAAWAGGQIYCCPTFLKTCHSGIWLKRSYSMLCYSLALFTGTLRCAAFNQPVNDEST